MRDFLAEIVEAKFDTVKQAKALHPLQEVRRRALTSKGNFALSKAFGQGDWHLIAECKLQSPSKGNFGHNHTVADLAVMYEQAGATALSVHTDAHFLGKNEDIPMVKGLVNIPVLRKEFIIDEYQIYEARMLGADAILLIARILTPEQLKDYLDLAHALGMDALVEVHDEEDLTAAQNTEAKFIGINNRNLKYFKTTIENTFELLPLADKSRILISESGIHTPEEAGKLREAGLKGILVGEGLSTAKDVMAQTRAFVNAGA